MGTLYVRVGNRTLPAEEAARLSPKEIEQAKRAEVEANKKRLENIQKSLGVKVPQGVTLDVTPAGVAARKAAIAAEEARIAAEQAAVPVEQPAEVEVPLAKAKKEPKKKATA